MVSKSFKTALGILAVALSIAGCSSTPAEMTVHGTVTEQNILDDTPVQDGSQVTVTDPSGKVLAFTSLSEDSSTESLIMFTFTVKVPEGESSYGIAVSGAPGTVHYTQQQMKAGPSLCVGDACSG